MGKKLSNSKIGSFFRAIDRDKLPQQLSLDFGQYRLQKIFKHDFFAATALYELNDDHNTCLDAAGIYHGVAQRLCRNFVLKKIGLRLGSGKR